MIPSNRQEQRIKNKNEQIKKHTEQNIVNLSCLAPDFGAYIH